MALPSALAPLRHRAFMLLFTGSVVTFLGAQIQMVGASWEMMSLTSSAAMVSLVQTATSLPSVIFALAGGALADMMDRRHVLIAAQSIMLVSACVLAVSQWGGLMGPWLLLGLTFMLNMGTALRMPAQSALANDMVEQAEVPGAVALISISSNIGRTIGPGVGGLLVAAVGAQAAFLANALCITTAIGTTSTWRAPAPLAKRRARGQLAHAMLEGLRYSWTTRSVRVLLVRVFAWVFCAVGLWGLMPLIAKFGVRGGPFTLGIMLACLGIGALGGATMISRWYAGWGVERLMRVTTWAFGGAVLAAGLIHSLVLLAPFLLLAGAAWILFMVTPSSALQMLAPAQIRARVVAVHLMVMYAAYGLGSWFWGVVADWSSIEHALLASGGLTLGNLVLARALPHRAEDVAGGA